MQWLQRAPLVFAIMLWPAQAPGELSWLSTDWIVTCEPDVPDSPNDPLCDDESAVGVAAITRSGLEQASVWFKDLGFHGPDVETVSRSYRARVSDTVTDGALGLYFSGLKELYVNSTYYFAIGTGETEAERRTTAGLQIAGMGTMVHELFHAIQHGYQPGDTFDSIAHDWIWEGTAHAVERVWLEQNDLHQEALFRPRRWDVPLDRPVDAFDAYATSRFWHWVGREIQSPGDIAYLQDVFENDLDRRRGLDGVDLALRQFRTGGLYALYPEFVARALKSKWRRLQYASVPEQTINLSADSPDARVEWTGARVEPIASNAHSVPITLPAEDALGVVVSLDSNAPDELHLIVNGRLASDTGPRGVHTMTLHPFEAETELDIRVANVAPDAPLSREQRYALTVEVSLLDPCSSDMMEATAHWDVMMEIPRQTPIDAFFGVTDAGTGMIRLSGAVSDSGVGCTYPISALNEDGAQTLGLLSSDEAYAIEGERLRATMEQLELLAGIPSRNMTAEDQKAMQELLSDLEGTVSGEMPEGAATYPRHVVIEVFSPNAAIWRTISGGEPQQTRHEGIGGWRPNARSHLLIQLPGTTPADLEPGKTYKAAAFAPAPDRDGSGSPILPTPDGFYARWSGSFERVPYPAPDTPQEAEIQRQMKQVCRNHLNNMRQNRGALDNADGGGWDCDYRRVDWEGESEIVSGSLSGTVTIDRITPTVITGTFELNGQGTRHVTEHRIEGHDSERAIGPAPLQASGSFRAGNGRPGLYRINHSSVRVE